MKRKTVVRKKQPENIVSVGNDWKEAIKATLFETMLHATVWDSSILRNGRRRDNSTMWGMI